MLFCFEIIQLLVEETNRYYHQHLDTQDERRCALLGITVQDLCLFLAINVQMGHDQRDMLNDYWSALEQYCSVFNGNTTKRDRFCHVLRCLHFSDNKNEHDKTDGRCDRL